MIVEAKNFHPMRGHVDVDTEVRFSNGAVLLVRPSGIGWALFNSAGDRVTDPGNDAWTLTRCIVELDAKGDGS